ncbi:MAG: GxxExxY protein [Flavobacteriales bacterium]
MTHNELSAAIIGAAIEVHRELGPGLLESIYEYCLAKELRALGIPFLQQQSVPVHYKGELLDMGFRLDLWVDRRIIVEIKAVDELHDVHFAQLLSYLKLTDTRLGLLVNFNETILAKGVRRVVNGLSEP